LFFGCYTYNESGINPGIIKDDKMIKILIPENKSKEKSKIRGFWKNETGKIYYDYLSLKTGNIKDLAIYKKEYKQECIFYKTGKSAKIFWNKNKIETLKKCYICHLTKNKLGNGALIYNIKKWINEYNGITVYIEKSEYIIEAWRV